jgi:hypothetical protein
MKPEDTSPGEEMPEDVVTTLPSEEQLKLESEVDAAEELQRRVLSTGLASLLAILVLELVLTEVVVALLRPEFPVRARSAVMGLFLAENWNLFVMNPGQDIITTSILRIIPLWLLTLGIAWSFFHFRVRAPLMRTRKRLRDFKDRQQRERLSTPEGRLSYLQEKTRSLSHETARVFLVNRARHDQASEWRQEAEAILDQGLKANLGEAESLVSSIYELIVQEEGELRAQRNWRFAATAIIVGYIAVLVAIALTHTQSDPTLIPVFGVPLSVAMWGATGSVAAILYRFYTERGRIQLELEVRWLIARPVIGIIMGMVAYLALSAGLLLLSANPPTGAEDTAQAGRQEVYWVIAFIAGFSDKFYERIIDLLVGTFGGPRKEKEADENSTPTEGAGEPPQDREVDSVANQEGNGSN